MRGEGDEPTATEDSRPPSALHEAVEQFFTSKRTPPAPRDLDLIGRGTRLDLNAGLAATAWGDDQKSNRPPCPWLE